MAKQRVSLTIDSELVERIDAEAEEENVNRSRKVEDIIEDYFESRGIDTAVVFCGDEDGKTLQVEDGETILEKVLQNLPGEVSRVILLAGPNGEEIEQKFGSLYDGVALEYIADDTSGTASALKKAEEKIGETFLAVNGHVVSDVDVDEMLETHREEGRVATMALTTVEEPSEYGVARLKGRRILGFEEKPSPGEEPSRLINAGTYILEPGIFSHLDEDSVEEVFENLAHRGELTGYIYGGRWREFN
jgi:mannose-1-phosphate guanylyltransferase